MAHGMDYECRNMAFDEIKMFCHKLTLFELNSSSLNSDAFSWFYDSTIIFVMWYEIAHAEGCKCHCISTANKVVLLHMNANVLLFIS